MKKKDKVTFDKSKIYQNEDLPFPAPYIDEDLPEDYYLPRG